MSYLTLTPQIRAEPVDGQTKMLQMLQLHSLRASPKFVTLGNNLLAMQICIKVTAAFVLIRYFPVYYNSVLPAILGLIHCNENIIHKSK